MRKILAALLICVLVVGVIVGCGSTDPIVGTWLDDNNSGDAMYINKDGTIGYRDATTGEDNKAGDGSEKWVKEGNTYYYIAIISGEEERYEITLDGDELSYSYGERYGISKYYREK